MSGVTIGSDPEVFVVGPDHKVVPAHHFGIPGPSDKVKTEFGSFFRDGWALEVNPIPSKSPEALLAHIKFILRVARKQFLPDDYKFSLRPAIDIDLKLLEEAPEDVKKFGCNPAYDAYALKVVVPTVDAATHPMRTTGCHLHFSGPTINDPEDFPKIIKMLDFFVGTRMVIDAATPASRKRRTLYGRAGEFRPQMYGETLGLEWRVPDALILANKDLFCFLVNEAVEVVNCHSVLGSLAKETEDRVQRAINDCDIQLCMDILGVKH